MNLLQQFKSYLESQDNRPSEVTIKNYVSDLNHFISWYETSFQRELNPLLINRDTIDLYIKSRGSVISKDVNGALTSTQTLTNASFERHISTVRKFGQLLEKEYGKHDILLYFTQKTVQQKDHWDIEGFKQILQNTGISHLTIKNYVMDLEHFKYCWRNGCQ